MNYKEIIEAIRESCLSNLSVNSFYEGDVYKINNESNVTYATSILTPGTHQINQYTTSYSFSLFYVDRLTHDRENKIDVQSTALTTLKEIINRLIDNYEEVDVDYTYPAQVFTERFTDECAGAYITFTLTVEDDLNECNYDDV